jgi:hypothetical protein
MKNLTKHLIMLMAIAISNLAISAPVSVEKAKTVAFNFIKNVDSQISSLDLVYTRHDAFYVFGSQSAWVIVSAQDAILPILAYSTESQFKVPENYADTTVGNNFWGWINVIEKQIRFVAENNISATDEIQNQWISMSRGNNKSPTTVVPPLLTTTWNQDWPYNSMCPTDPWGPGGHVYAGCVAVAMAQIMKYHNWPSQGLGSYGYTWQSYPYSGANFGTTTYNWANMPNSISSVNADVSTIIYHAGVATRSMWGSSSTGVVVTSNDNPMLTGFINYFKMAFSTIKYVLKSDYTDTDWHNLIQAELIANRPVYYRGDGSLSHAWVCDGVDAGNYYHFNWGWGGSYNGYFALSNINPGGNNLSNNQHALVGIKPNDGSTLVTNTTWSGTITKTTNVAVPDAITLTVGPGAVVSFNQDCKLQIWGKLSSIGTSSNYAKLTASNQTNGWDGIDFKEDYMDRMADNDTSKFIYTQIEYSKSSGLYIYDYGKVVVDHCKINDNLGFNGAGVFVNNNSIQISNSEFNDNNATNVGGGLYLNLTDNVAVNVCNNDIHGNSAISGGGFWLFAYDNMSFENNIIRLNWAGNGAGGALGGGNPSLVNNRFVNNTTPSPGFGCLYLENCNAKIVGNLIANNTANGIFCKNSSPLILNNTISNNNHDFGSGIVFDENSDANIKNCIIYGNYANNSSYGHQITIWSNDSDPYFDHSNIEGGLAGFGGPGAGGNYSSSNYTNNIDLNPLFVSPSAGAGNGYSGLTADWSLQATSPCVNAGDTTGVSQYLPSLDLAGNPRIVSIIDMGGYEYGCQVPAQPSSITGSTNPCQTSSQVYSVTNVTGVSYAWTVPSGSSITAGQGSSSITVTIGPSSGNISVTPSNACGNGTSRSLAITVNTVPAQPSAITGNANPCQASSQTYSVTNVSGVTYTWTVPSGSSITAGQGTNSITVTIGASSGNISVVPSNACGNGTARTLAITVNTVPAQPSVITGNISPCQASSQTYSVTNVAGVSYAWTVPSGSSITAGQGSNSISVTIGPSSGNISVTPSNACGNGTSSTLAITVNTVPAQPSAITGNANPCQGSSQVYSVTNVAGVSYAWTVPSGSSITAGQGTNSIIVATGTTSGEVEVTPSNSCGNGISRVLAIAPQSVVADAGTDQTINNGSSTTLSGSGSGGSGTYGYSWEPASLLINNTVAAPTTVPLSASAQFVLTITDISTGCIDSDEVIVNVTGGALTVTATANPANICKGSSSQLNALASGGSGVYSYSWVSNPAGFSSTLANPVVWPLESTQYTVEVNDGVSTASSSVTVVVTLLPEAPLQPTGPDTVDLLQNGSSMFTTGTVPGATAYEWLLEPAMLGTWEVNGPICTITWSGSLGTGQVKVRAVGSCGAGEWSQAKEVVIENTTTTAKQGATVWQLYPNPANDQVAISSKNQLLKVQIADLAGRVIAIQTLAQPQFTTTINTSGLTPSVYLLTIITPQGQFTRRMVISH